MLNSELFHIWRMSVRIDEPVWKVDFFFGLLNKQQKETKQKVLPVDPIEMLEWSRMAPC